MDKKRRQRGIVFFTSLILLSIVILICVGISLLALRDTYSVKRIKYTMQARYLAEAGVEEAIKEIHGNFDWSPSGYPKYLGDGEYSVSVSTFAGDSSRKLITSVGTVGGITRTILAQVRYQGPEAFNYTAMGGGKLTVMGDTIISNTGPIEIHSNSPAASKAIEVGGFILGFIPSPGEVDGSASACGEAYVHPTQGKVIPGPVTSGAPYVDLPPFDDNFFQYYYNLAASDTGGSKVYNVGVKVFNDDPFKSGTTNHVVYVNGQVRLDGTWTTTGCIVATGKIIINKWATGKITINQWGILPALMSKNSDIEIWDPSDITGMVYANGVILIESIFGAYGPTNIYGCLYGKSWVRISARTRLHYVRPNPPGLPSGTIAVNVLSWSEA